MRGTGLPLTIVLCFILPASALAQGTPRWLVRVEAGSAAVHRFVDKPEGLAGGIRFARAWKGDRIRFDAGVLGSNADQGFLLVDFGGELRFLGADARIAPFVGGSVGVLAEPVYGHDRARRAGGGLEVRLGPNRLLRVAAYAGGHNARARGPHLIVVGYSQRLGGR